jgi:hypothetical protein
MSIPSAAILSTHEISGGAFKLYACYCVHREGFEANVKNEQIRAETGLGYAYISTLKFELLEAGWIGLSNSSKKGIVPLKGFEVPAEQVRAERKLSKIERTSDKKLSNIETSGEKVSKVESPEKPPVKVSKINTLLSDEVSKIESFSGKTFENQKEIAGTEVAPLLPKTTSQDKNINNHNRAREGSAFTHEVHAAVGVYRDVFGNDPPVYGQDQIERDVSDLTIWREVCEQWRGNNNARDKVWNMVDAYKKRLKGDAKPERNGKVDAPPRNYGKPAVTRDFSKYPARSGS